MSSSASKLNIDSLSYQELKKECKKAKLSTSGPMPELKKRLRANNPKPNTSKRAAPKKGHANPPNKKSKSSPEDDLICPITLELPVDPVVAEDGRTYENAAIMEYFSSKPGAGKLKSPMTNTLMGRRLQPTMQAKSFIETLIERGEITGELAATWKRKNQEKKEVEELTKKAESGSVLAMLEVARLHAKGKKVGRVDYGLALHWYKKAADAGDTLGMMLAAHYLVVQPGKVASGTALMAMAAQGGYDIACIDLGTWFADGKHGLPVDKGQAIRLLQMGVSGTCARKDAPAADIKAARATLQRLKK